MSWFSRWQVFGLKSTTLWLPDIRLPTKSYLQCLMNTRSLLPLRVSSGFTPDSLFSHLYI